MVSFSKACVFRRRKGKYVDMRGFHPLPAPPPITYSLAGSDSGDWKKISGILRLFPIPD
jgi:hypothetical protein